MSSPDILLALEPVINAFEKLGIPYHIGGSVASATLGVARSTVDVDVIAEIPSEQVSDLRSLLEDQYYIDEEMIQEAISHRGSFNLIHLETMFKVDVFLPGRTLYDDQAFHRVVEATLDESSTARTYRLATAEDIVLNKLRWYKMGGAISERQWNDVLGILKVQSSNLDFEYLRKWADDLDFAELLERVFTESGVALS
jgi:hypothetical protein